MNTAVKIALPTVKLTLPTGFQNDKTKEGWELLEDVPLTGDEELELAEFLREGENSVLGEVMFERAVKLGNRAGQRHAERLLSQANLIPKEWRDFYLVFPGTKWRDSDGFLVVPFLLWDGDKWSLYWLWLGHDWDDYVRLVRRK